MRKPAAMPFAASLRAWWSTAGLTLLAVSTLLSGSASAQVSVTATAGTPGPTPYTTVKLAFDAINAGTHQGDITIDIAASTVEGATPATLNSNGAGSAAYTSVLLRPTADAVSISGNTASGFGVIQLNGADNVTIDGDNPNSPGINRDLTIANTAVNTIIANSAVRIATSAAVTSADNDTIKNCILIGNVTGGNAAAITSTTGSSNSSFGIYAGGNGGATPTGAPTPITSVTANTAPTGTTINALTINNNLVNACARAIVFNGAVAAVSNGVTVTNNTIGDQGIPSPAIPPYTSPATTVYTKAVWLNGTNALTVTGNTLTNVMSYVGTTITAVELAGAIGPTVVINNNTISNPANNGTASIVKAVLVSNATGGLVISGNIISNVQALGGASGTAGIDASGAGVTSGTIELNKLTTIYNRNAGTFGPWGISIGAGSNITIRNNFVSDLNMNMTGGAAFSTTFGIHGLRIAGGTGHKVYHNSVNMFGALSGTPATSILTAALTIAGTGQTGVDVRNNALVNTLSGGTTGIAHVSIFLPSGGTSAMNLILNNSGYYFGTDPLRQGVGQAGTTAGVNFFTTLAALRAYSSTLGPGATNDNASFATTALAPFTSPTDLHVPAATPTQLESAGAPVGVTTDIDGELRSGTTPDIGADEFAGIFVDLTPPTIGYVPLGNTSSLGNRTLANVSITDASGVNNAAGTRPRIYYKKSTDANAFVGNTPADNGWKFVETSDVASPYSFTADYSLLTAPVVIGDQIQYFVVAQDLATTPNVGINSGTFATTPASVNLGPAQAPIGGSINSYLIATPLNGARTVGAGGDFATLTGVGGAFATINANVLTGNLTITVVGDLIEDGTNALNQWAEEGGGGFTLTIRPDAAGLRTISGAVANGLIRLNGADRVTVDGRFGGTGQFLLFRNTNASNPTFTLLNDATSNTLESLIIEGANTSTASGTVVFGTSTGTLGNSGNLIHASDIRDRSDAAGVPANAVFSSGSGSALNANNTVSGCNVFNWTNAGVLVTAAGAGNGWTVNPSSFYQTAARTTPLTGISIQGGSGHTISGNSVGGTAPNAGGTFLSTNNTFRGIDLTVGTVSPTSVQGNTVKNIRSTFPATSFTASYGIFLEAGRANIGTVVGNTVGSSDPNQRYEISGDSFGIRVVSTSIVDLRNNVVDNFGTAATPPTGEFYFGMSVEGAGGAHTVIGNSIRHVTNNSIPDASFSTQTTGMVVSATGIQTIRGNVISDIGSTNPSVVVTNNNRIWGLIASGTAVGTVVDGNSISNVFGSSPTTGLRADVITGLQSQAVANGTFTNNMISLSGGAGPSDRPIFALLDLSAAPAVSNYYYNSVNVFGTSTGANNTYAFNRNSNAAVTLRDNAFSNPRAVATGFNVAMANTNASATGWPAGASDFNRLHNLDNSHLTQWLGSGAGNNLNLAGFQAASGGDASTQSGDPLFVSNTDLHLQPTSPAVAAAIPFGGVVSDFDNDPRSPLTPDIGADELVPAAVDLSITKGHSGAPAPGQPVVYTVTATNPGPKAAPNTAIVDTFPAALTCSYTAVGTGGASGFTAAGAGNINDLAVNLPGASSVTYTATCGIASSATGSLSNTATVTGSAAVIDTNPTNNSATDAYVLAPTADVAVSKTDGVTTATPGGSLTYTIVASNPGPSDAPGTSVTDAFPASLSCTWTCVGSGGGSCAAGPVPGDINDTANLPAGGAAHYTAMCAVSPSASGSIANTATVAPAAGVTDPSAGNNSATDTDTVTTGGGGGVRLNESEPNGTAATANPLAGNSALVVGNIFPNGDIDFFSFSANAGDRAYAAIMGSWSPNGSSDSQLTLIASDGTTTVEFDDDDGALGGLSSSIAGATIPSAGTYYLKVNHFSATNQLRPYELYFRLQTGAPTPEVEPNDSPGTANLLPAGGWVSGARNPAVATEQDWYSFTANAGDSVFLSMDLDPERDNVQWDGRLGIALFGDAGNQILVVDDHDAGSVANPLSEAHFMTVKTTGTYFAFVDSATAATGGPTATYNLSVTVIPAQDEGVNCTTYTSTDVPQTIGPGTGLVSSTITIPGNPRIADMDVEIQLNHALMSDVDAHLRSPAGNDNGLFTDIGAAATGGQQQMDIVFDDEAAIPPLFTVLKGLRVKPEVAYRLSWFDGEDAGGTWTLDLRDDTANASGGTLNSWSLRVCEAPPPPACPGGTTPVTVFSTDFESGDAGFTHSGTADEWELGLPATAGTTTANPVAAFTTCNSGVNCWKTDLDNTYEISSSQDLLSPAIDLTGLVGPVVVSWAQRYQVENATFDRVFIDYQQAGGATPVRFFEWHDGTMTDAPGNPALNLAASSGWSRLSGRADSLAGLNTELRFHLDSDSSINFAGLAVDDVTVTACQPVTGSSADLAITKTDGVTTATPGGSVTYTITASNAGPDPATGATVADTFPATLTCTWTCAGAGGGTCTAAGAGNINDSVNLPAGGSVTYTASCLIAPSATGSLSNTATVTPPSGVGDPTPGNNSATDTDTLGASADVSITKTDGVTTATPGGSVTYTITASNAGPSDAPGTTVADTFPASLTCTWTCAGSGGGTCTASGAGNINDIANLPVGGSAIYTATCNVDPSATGSISNTATAATAGGITDPNPANNSATDVDSVVSSADLSVTKTDGVTSAIPGAGVTYTIVVSNAGPSPAPGSQVADTFPASLTCTWTCVGSGGGTCTASGAGNISDSANLPAGGAATYTATCGIASSATGTLSNTATVDRAVGIQDPDPNNNSATDTDTLDPTADLSITKDDGVTTAIPGTSVTYTIAASNPGPSDAPGTTVADAFPPSLTCTWTCTGSGGGTCSGSGAGNINDTANLPSGGSATYTATCSISDSASGSLSNTATVAAAGGITDPTPGNNSATDTDTLVPTADLSITKDDGVTSVPPGGSVTYTIVASNPGPSFTDGNSVTDNFDANLTCTWTCAASGGGLCNPGPVSGNINDLADLPVGASATYTASCAVSAAASGTLPNTVTIVPAIVTDPDPSNNSATDVDAIAQSISIADVTVTEGNSGTTPADFVVTLDAPSAATITVDFTTVDGTATVADNDYTPLSGTLIFAPGDTSKIVSGSVIGDLNVEADETFTVVLSNPVNAVLLDDTGLGTIINDDAASSLTSDELIHDSRETRSLGLLPGTANPTFFRIMERAHASYEVVVDAVTGDIGSSGPSLDRLASDGTTVLQSSGSATGGSSRSLRFENATPGDISDQYIRVQSAGCDSNCDPADTYRIRAYDTTYRMSRFNNSASQVTVAVVNNPTDQPVTGTLWFWGTDGSLLIGQPVNLQPKATFVLNTSSVGALAGQSGSVTFSNDAPFGALSGKAVAVEPATGFTFDTAMVPRAASTKMVPRDN